MAIPGIRNEPSLTQRADCVRKRLGLKADPLMAPFGVGQRPFEDFATAIQDGDAGAEQLDLVEEV